MQRLKTKGVGKKRGATRYGDTIVEAVIAIAIYSVVAVLALASMNSGLKNAQTNLETTMARASMDTQVDTLRYIYENYVLTKLKSGETDSAAYKRVWETITKSSGGTGYVYTLSSGETVQDYIHTSGSCSEIIKADDEVSGHKAFALNPRAIYSSKNVSDINNLTGAKFASSTTDATSEIMLYNTGDAAKDKIKPASLYPRLVYLPQDGSADNGYDGMLIGSNEGASEDKLPSRNVSRSEGVWIIGLANTGGKLSDTVGLNYSYDFYVRTCWNASGESNPSMFTTVVRLYKVED